MWDKRIADTNSPIWTGAVDRKTFETIAHRAIDNYFSHPSYYKIDGNLNSYTNIFADDIFLYYTRDAKAGTPIISLGTSKHVANWSHGEGNRYVVTTVLNRHGEPSDLNDGALGDYIYLLQTRDKTDENSIIASMIGNGSLVIIIAFAVVSAVVIAWIYIAQKKRRVEAAADNAKDSKNDESR